MNIITALGNKRINERLKKETQHYIDLDDVQYKEGIIEILEKNYNYDLIIISDILFGEISTLELIKQIKNINKNIEIIIFLENKNNLIENSLTENNIKNIFYNNELTIEKLIKEIEKIDLNKKQINNEIEIIKELILKNTNEKNKFDIMINKVKELFGKYLNNHKINAKKQNIKSIIINIFGNKKARENSNFFFISIKY